MGNFNIEDESYDGEYNLFRSTTEELINLYGTKIKYVKTQKINQDEIFGEHSHIKVDDESVYEMYMLLNTSDMWEGEGTLYSKFGMQDMSSASGYVSKTSMELIHPEIVNRTGKITVDKSPLGNLIVFGSNKVMQITNIELSTAGVGNNNVFTSDRTKNVYKLTMKTYIANRDDYSSSGNITTSENYDYDENDFASLDKLFAVEDDNLENISHRAEDFIMEDEVIYPAEVRRTPIRNKSKETNPFGILG